MNQFQSRSWGHTSELLYAPCVIKGVVIGAPCKSADFGIEVRMGFYSDFSYNNYA